MDDGMSYESTYINPDYTPVTRSCPENIHTLVPNSNFDKDYTPPTMTVTCCDRCDRTNEKYLILTYDLDDIRLDLCMGCTRFLLNLIGKDVMERFVKKQLPVDYQEIKPICCF